jgi:rod shape determining protein RodA
MMGKNSQVVEKYLDEVVSNIVPTSLKQDVRSEIECHLNDSIQEGVSYGLSQERAVAVAIERMGNPVDLGTELFEIHRPRLNWWLIVPTFALVLLGWFLMNSMGHLGGQVVFSVIGLAIGSILAFVDFSRIRRFSWVTYGVTFVSVIIAILIGHTYERQPYLFLGPLRIKLMDLCPFLFVIALAGVIDSSKWRKIRNSLPILLAIMMVGVLYGVTNSLPSLVLFTISIIAIMYTSSARPWQVALVGLMGIAVSLHLYSERSFVSAEAFRSTQGVESHTDYVITYLINTFGRGLGLLGLGLAFLVWMRLADIARVVRSEPSRLVLTGLTALLGSEFVWSILANLGWAPMPTVGINFPLLSFGGSLLVMHLAALGIAVSTYRRKTLRLA